MIRGGRILYGAAVVVVLTVLSGAACGGASDSTIPPTTGDPLAMMSSTSMSPSSTQVKAKSTTTQSSTGTTMAPVGTTTTATTAKVTTTEATTTTEAPSTAQEGPLEIVTLQYDAPGNDDNNNLNEEYIVFRVTTSSSLRGYVVEDAANHRYSFPDMSFDAGDTFTLHTGSGTTTASDLYWGASGSAIWNNDGDTVTVLDPNGKTVLSYTYSE